MNIEEESKIIQQFVDKGNFHAATNTQHHDLGDELMPYRSGLVWCWSFYKGHKGYC
jgi:hypothetical protein